MSFVFYSSILARSPTGPVGVARWPPPIRARLRLWILWIGIDRRSRARLGRARWNGGEAAGTPSAFTRASRRSCAGRRRCGGRWCGSRRASWRCKAGSGSATCGCETGRSSAWGAPRAHSRISRAWMRSSRGCRGSRRRSSAARSRGRRRGSSVAWRARRTRRVGSSWRGGRACARSSARCGRSTWARSRPALRVSGTGPRPMRKGRRSRSARGS